MDGWLLEIRLAINDAREIEKFSTLTGFSAERPPAQFSTAASYTANCHQMHRLSGWE
ncbi:MAG: hypothetical protein ACLQIB_21550 [Isosphaeraceae bacterium]